MRMGIKFKMFLIFIATSITIIASMLFFVGMALKSGFLNYVDGIEEKRMTNLCSKIEFLYAKAQNFNFLNNEKNINDLNNLLYERSSSNDITKKFPETKKIIKRSEHNKEENHNERREHKKTTLMLYSENNSESDFTKFKSYFFVLDINEQPIFGEYNSEKPIRLLPIYYPKNNDENNNIIGYLGIYEDNFDLDTVQKQFMKSQLYLLTVIGLAMITVSFFIALFTANHFQRTIKILVQGTKSLTSGNYRTRLMVFSNDELGDLTNDFNKLATNLENNELARKKWVDDIAHEFKTPLALMSGEIEAINDGIREFTPLTIKHLNADIYRLNSLVEDFRHLWQSESHQLKLSCEPLRLNKLIENGISKFSHKFEQQQITLKLDLKNEVYCSVDNIRLGQVFDNICRNSLRYTDSPGIFSATIQRNLKLNIVTIIIEDSSPSVPTNELNKIFNRLYRVEKSRNRNLGGSGIGLTICKNVIEAHNGKIRAEKSEEFGGLKLIIELPIEE